jgi:DnaK suppressor protein
MPGKKKTRKKVDSSEETRKKRYRKILLAKREEILREVKDEIGRFIRGENRQLVETALDDGDWSVVDLVEDINLRKMSSHKETLNKIDEALRKIDEGTYGICNDCGSEISDGRLEVLPFAIYCVECMEKRENLEEIVRED